MSTVLCTKHAVVEHSNAATLVSVSLSAWLSGSWGILYSHANDFAWTGLESDRWLVVLAEAFASARIRPLAYACDLSPGEGSWVLEVGGLKTIIPPEATRCPQLVDLHACRLCEAIKHTTTRFVMIIDGRLQLRRSLSYRPGACLPSVLDLVATAQRNGLLIHVGWHLSRSSRPETGARRSGEYQQALMSFSGTLARVPIVTVELIASII